MPASAHKNDQSLIPVWLLFGIYTLLIIREFLHLSWFTVVASHVWGKKYFIRKKEVELLDNTRTNKGCWRVYCGTDSAIFMYCLHCKILSFHCLWINTSKLSWQAERGRWTWTNLIRQQQSKRSTALLIQTFQLFILF